MCKCTPELRTPFCGKPGCTNKNESPKWVHIEPHIGRFRVTNVFVRDNFDLVKVLMGMMVVVKAEVLFHVDAIEYTAYSYDLFEDSPVGHEPPFYNIIFDNKTHTFTAEKVDL